MLSREPFLYRSSNLVKVLSFLLIIMLSLLVTLIIGVLIGFLLYGNEMMDYVKGGVSFSDPALLPMLKYLQVINTIGLFLVPPIVFSFLVSKNPGRYLAMHIKPKFVSTLVGIALIVAILPFLHWTAAMNEMLCLPEYFSGIEEWMKTTEARALELTTLFLSTTSIAGLAVNLLMVAVLPAIGEEFLFRGVLLRLIKDWTKNAHVAVIISAFLFSALHMQFYGFVPRFILGIFLGYTFVWTRSIWVPVIIHFFNNGLAVFAAWLYARGGSSTDVDSFGEVDQPGIIIASFITVLLLASVIWFYEAKKKEAPLNDASHMRRN